MRVEYLLRDFLGEKFQVYLKEWFLSHIICMHMNLFVQSLSHVQLFATPWIAAHRASLSIGISQARILERVAISFSRGSSWTRDWTPISHISRWILYHWATRRSAWICISLQFTSVGIIYLGLIFWSTLTIYFLIGVRFCFVLNHFNSLLSLFMLLTEKWRSVLSYKT